MISTEKPKDFKPKFEVSSCFIEHDGKFLLLHRQDHKPQGDTWGAPAGKVEKGETSVQAIAREMHEEIGLLVGEKDLEFFKRLYVRFDAYDFVYDIFAYQSDIQPNIIIDDKDHKDFRWVTPKEALTMNLIQDEDYCINLYYK